MGKIESLKKVNLLQFIRYNYFSKKIVRDHGCYLLPYRGAKIEIRENARMILHANYVCCSSKMKRSKAEAYLQILEGATMEVKGRVFQNYDSHVEVNQGAKISIGETWIKPNAVIVSNHDITIGNDVLISRYVVIYDSDFHKIRDTNGEMIVHSKRIVIGNHVWIGIKCNILKGANIGDGAVITVGSTVSGKIKSGTSAMGYPARSFSSVEWEK